MRRVFVVLSLFAVPLESMAAWFGAEFSAEAMQFNPQTKQSQPVGKMFAGKDKVRLEATRGNQTQVMIVDAANQKTYMISPAERTYMEMQGVQAVPMLAVVPMPDAAGSPCQQPSSKMSCKKVGDEVVNDLPTEKWEFVVEQEGNTLRSVQWLDRGRSMAIRQEFPSGQMVERKLLGKETVNGREAEKWQVTAKQGNQAPQQSTEWVDPQLKAAIRQERAQGQATELRNVTIGAQPDTLFVVPEGYQKRDMPTQGPGGGAPHGTPPGR